MAYFACCCCCQFELFSCCSQAFEFDFFGRRAHSGLWPADGSVNGANHRLTLSSAIDSSFTQLCLCCVCVCAKISQLGCCCFFQLQDKKALKLQFTNLQTHTHTEREETQSCLCCSRNNKKSSARTRLCRPSATPTLPSTGLDWPLSALDGFIALNLCARTQKRQSLFFFSLLAARVKKAACLTKAFTLNGH